MNGTKTDGDAAYGITKRLVFLHGFLGSPLDWRETIAYLPNTYSCQALDLAEDVPHALPSSSILIGYSMGGRIALQLPPTKGLVLIGAHFGLADEKEKTLRHNEEQKLLEHLQNDPLGCIDWWYRQPLFSTLVLDEELRKRRQSVDFAKHVQLFERFRLSLQPFCKPPDSALLLYGERDKKYATLYSHWSNSHAIPDAGHAAHIENPKMTAQFIQEYVENIL